MLVSGGQGFMSSEVTYGVSRIARVLLSSRVRLCSLLRASNRAFVLPFCLLFLSSIVLAIMSTRQTNNSLAAAFPSTVVSSAPASNASSSTPSSRAVSSQSDEPVVVSSSIVSTGATVNSLPATSTTILSPELVAVINQAVQVAVQASQRQQQTATVCSTSCSGASSSPSSLGGLASSFLAAGTGFQPAISSSSMSGRTIPLQFPTFVSNFNAPVPVIASSSGHVLSGISAQLPSSHVSSLVDQPFIAGPGFSPVPAKLVSQILSGKFVDLSELLSANLVNSEPGPQLMLDQLLRGLLARLKDVCANCFCASYCARKFTRHVMHERTR